MSKSVHYQRVKEHLEALKLHTALSELDPLLEAAGRDEQTPVEVLDHLLGIERDYRFERRVQANLRLSGIPNRKTLEEFDYQAQPWSSPASVDT